MEIVKERNFVCKFCSKEFLSGKALGGHIRIHTNENSVASEKNKRLALKQQRTQQQQQQLVRCRECDQEFDSLKAFCNHMAFHSERDKIVMDSQSDTETSSSPTRKRSKRIQSFSNGSSSSASEIDQEHKHMALSLMMMSRDPSFKNSLAESSDNNSVILETKSSSGEQLKISNAGEFLDKVAVDKQLRSGDDNNGYDSDSSGSDYFMNGPKKSDSDISIATGHNNSFLKRFRKSDEGGSKYELRRKSKRVFFLPYYETDSCEAVKIHSKKAKKKSKGHECPICFRVFKSGQALGGHKRSHFIGNQEQVAEMHRDPIDLNLPALEID